MNYELFKDCHLNFIKPGDRDVYVFSTLFFRSNQTFIYYYIIYFINSTKSYISLLLKLK